jgi:hypothetical protein
VDRQRRIYELETMLDEEHLDPADELEVREPLERLGAGGVHTEDERRRWEVVKEKAPGLWEKSGARSIMEPVISAAIRAQLGI